MTTDNLPTAAPTPAAPTEPAATPAVSTTIASPPAAPEAPDPAPVSPPPAQAAPVPAPAPTTIVEGNTKDKPVTAPADFPEDWRTKLAANDPKELARLERFGSPADVYKAYRALEQKMSSGLLKEPLPKDATPEQLTQFRKDNGIPETPDKYDLTLPGGLIIGEQDKPLVNEFLKEMHTANASPEHVKSALAAYYKIVQNQKVQVAEQDSGFRSESESALRSEWGGDFKKNVGMVSTLLETAPPGVKDKILGGRTAEGKLIGDDPAVLKFLAGVSREINPAATVVPNAGYNAPTAIADEIKDLTRQMGNRASDYWSKDKGPALQQRYRDLVTVQEKINKKTG